MKKYSSSNLIVGLTAILLLFFFSCSTNSSSHTVRVMTYNIKNDYNKEGPNNWESRKDELTKMIKDQNVAFLGVQEALINQIKDIESVLGNYSYVGHGRDGIDAGGEYCALFYDSTHFVLNHQKTFWLSETPEIVSKGWDAALPRIATLGIFTSLNSSEKILVLNTHFDHIGSQARLESAKLLVQHARTYTDIDHTIIMGDLNAEPSSLPIQLIASSFQDASKLHLKNNDMPKGTFNGFDTTQEAERRIDYIFIKGFSVDSYAHLDYRTENGMHLSDHFPVVVQLDLKK